METYIEREDDQTKALARPDLPAVFAVITVATWFDRTYGNSYFAGRVLNTVAGDSAPIPFQYGHGRSAFALAAQSVSEIDMTDDYGRPLAGVEIRECEVSTMKACKAYAD